MKIVVPMAGTGDRFSMYKESKPLIRIRGKRMIEYVCDMFNKDADEFIFIVNSELYQQGNIKPILEKYVKYCKVVSVPLHHKGPVWTVFTSACPFIEKEEPVIVVYCDTPLIWDYEKLKDYASTKDGVIVTNIGFHPHSLASTMMAYCRTEGDRIIEVKEKSCYTDNHFKEHASAGLYWFRKGSYIHDYFWQALENNVQYGGEHYVTLVYNLMIADGLKVNVYPADHVLAFGTPCEVQNYEAWQTIIEGGQVKNEADLIQCYKYWNNVKDSTPGKY